MNVLVLNAGSSTLKFQLVRTDAERIAAHTDEKLARGQVERIGGALQFGRNADAAVVLDQLGFGHPQAIDALLGGDDIETRAAAARHLHQARRLGHGFGDGSDGAGSNKTFAFGIGPLVQIFLPRFRIAPRTPATVASEVAATA